LIDDEADPTKHMDSLTRNVFGRLENSFALLLTGERHCISAVAFMVARGGFEPPTFGLCDLTHRSTRLSQFLPFQHPAIHQQGCGYGHYMAAWFVIVPPFRPSVFTPAVAGENVLANGVISRHADGVGVPSVYCTDHLLHIGGSSSVMMGRGPLYLSLIKEPPRFRGRPVASESQSE
jgi:hypothetical protein